MEPKYRRILLKLSGEALAGENKFGLDYGVITNICESVKKCLDAGVEIGIVVGGGNFWNGQNQSRSYGNAGNDYKCSGNSGRA